MTWTEWMIAGPVLFYLAGAAGHALKKEWGFALAYLCYAVANVGLIWAAVSGR